MSFIALLIFLFTGGMAGLILYVSYKSLRKSALTNKKDRLKVVDEEYQEVVLLKKQHKNSDQNKKK
jgi:hypothetical protein